MRKFFNLWVMTTLALYYAGPIEWAGRKEPYVALFVITCVVFFNLGYVSLREPEIRGYTRYDRANLLEKKLFVVGVMLTFFGLSLLHMQIVTGQSFTSALTNGLSFSTVYSDYQTYIQDGLALGRMEQLVLLFKAALFPVALVLICKYYQTSLLVTLLFFVPMIVFSLARGTDKETVDLVLILAIIAHYYGLGWRTKAALILSVPLVMYVFVLRKFGRFDEQIPDCLPDSVTCFNFDGTLASISPLLEIGYVMAVHYVTQGYEGLNLAFGLDFHFNFGLGHLPPLQSMFCGVFGLTCDPTNFSESLAAIGWDTRYRWSTAYTSLANDLHWTLVPFYLFFIGWSLRLAEQEWKSRANPSALAVIVLIGIFTLYSSANMQLAISLDWVVATVFLLYGKALLVRTRRI